MLQSLKNYIYAALTDDDLVDIASQARGADQPALGARAALPSCVPSCVSRATRSWLDRCFPAGAGGRGAFPACVRPPSAYARVAAVLLIVVG